MEEMRKLPKVNIILATYNGEKYLKKQLDSLLAQTYENMDIYIRDDGSKDRTVAFLENYIAEHAGQKKMILLKSGGKNLKCPESFYEIIRTCQKADYYSLCDQDDYWYPNKVAWAVERLEQEEKDQVLVYYSACDYLTEEGAFIRKSPLQKEKIHLEDTLFYTPGSGFTVVFNEKARQKLILEHTPGMELHDRWLLRGAACFGRAVYDSRSTAAHIRHQEAVTAADSDNGKLISNFIRNELCGKDGKKDKEALRYFYDSFHLELSTKECKMLELFSGEKNIPVKWAKKVFFTKRLRRRIAGEIALRMLFFLGRI